MSTTLVSARFIGGGLEILSAEPVKVENKTMFAIELEKAGLPVIRGCRSIRDDLDGIFIRVIPGEILSVKCGRDSNWVDRVGNYIGGEELILGNKGFEKDGSLVILATWQER